MGWQDRRYQPPEEGGFRRAMRRVFGEDGNFFAWSIPLFRVAGIRVKIHLLFVIYIVSKLIQSMGAGSYGLWFTVIELGVLFGIVLLHEFGHCFACRWVGGEANEILMWPLGGLAMCLPPHTPRATLITTIGGPLVNVLLIPVFAGGLLLAGARPEMLLFNPLDPSGTFKTWGWFTTSSNLTLYAHVGLWWAYTMNIYNLLFNVLLPMFPMDCARLVQELLWFKLGFRRSMEIVVKLGLFMAIAVGVYAATTANTLLMGIALFCGLTCWSERAKLAVMEPEQLPGYDFSRGFKGMPGGDERRAGGTATRVRTGPTKAEIKEQKAEEELQAEIDRILEKIRTEGMASLTKREKETLRGETERKRRESAGH